MINKKLESEIIEKIETTDGFSAQDFNISSSDVSENRTSATELRIDMYGTKYNFTAQIPHRRINYEAKYGDSYLEFSIDIKCNPGELVDSEKQILEGKSELLSRIGAWCGAIKVDIDSTYTHRKIEEQRSMISKLTEELKSKDDFFTPEEAQNIREELGNQKVKFEDELKKQFEISEELEAQLKSLKDDFDELEKRLFTQTKGGWLRSWAGRAFKWSANPENQQAIIETSKTVKALLTNGTPE